MCGLFLDTGALVLLEKNEAYKKVLEVQPTYPYSIIKFEDQKYETNHALVGYLLALNWKVPDNVALAILYSHTPTYDIFEDPKLRALVAVVQLSYCMIGEELAHDPLETEEHLKFRDRALNELMLPIEDVEQIVNEAINEAINS
jgi:HD-like signal output (HDOD) protein